MSRIPHRLIAALFLTMLTLVGCSQSNPPAPHRGSAAPPDASAADHSTGQDPAAAESADKEKEIAEALAKLPEAERAVAEAQRICPISGERLGSMATPIKVSLEGQDVFLCCAGCKKQAEAEPADTLAKLKK